MPPSIPHPSPRSAAPSILRRRDHALTGGGIEDDLPGETTARCGALDPRDGERG
ncbi:MAG: hypothetical protein R3234_02285 [Thermoanaerobaculia bacterium]|nr:hypothetical protein [Thermoanaerobaculia bacterium]